MTGKEENLKDLFEKFMDAEHARQAAQDIQNADQLFIQHPAPAPDEKLIANIKAEITEKLRQKPNAFKQITYKAIAVAAAVIIVTSVSIKLFENQTPKSQTVTATTILSQNIWDSEDITTDDENLATLIAEIEQIENEILAFQLDENGNSLAEDIEELEMELIAMNTDFWKG